MQTLYFYQKCRFKIVFWDNNTKAQEETFVRDLLQFHKILSGKRSDKI
jgi:hypothetical protein